jgi:long-chain acyl-CoA synthetase
MLVQDFLQNSAHTYPDKIALVCPNQRLSYKEIDRMANKCAQGFIESGIQRGDRIVIMLPNIEEAVISIFGVLKASATFVFINPTIKQEKLIYILNNCSATALVTSYRLLNLARDALVNSPSVKICLICGKMKKPLPDKEPLYDFDEFISDFSEERPPCRTIDVDLACLIYTSGSTGEPKGVMEAHNNVVFATKSIITYLQNTADDIVINVLPFSFDYGLYQLLMVFRFGGTLVLGQSFNYPAQVFKAIEKEKVTGLPGVPTLFAIMAQMDLEQFNLKSLRYITNTAAAFAPKHIKKFREKLPRVKIYSMYGLTECKRTLYLPPDEIDRRTDSVGIAIPGTEVWIEDESGKRLVPGETGELVIRGSHVMRGYWNDPETTNRVYRPGPIPGERILYSGDLFTMDKEGYYYFIARKDDVLKSRGEKVPPKEIENILYQIEGVVEAAVIGVPDQLLGQAIKAFVVVKNTSITEKDIKEYCVKHLENFMVPQFIELRESLPKTSSGKINKLALS